MYDGAYGALARKETQQDKKNQSKKTPTNQQQKPTPNTKHKTVASTEVRREGETVLTRSVLLLKQIAQ